jgi:hypothetical protein
MRARGKRKEFEEFEEFKEFKEFKEEAEIGTDELPTTPGLRRGKLCSSPLASYTAQYSG